MPTYDYKCKTCGKEFEYQQKMSDNALETCPVELCQQVIKGEGEVIRVMSKNIGLVFKGSGFYLTDYNKKAKETTTSSPTPPPCSSGSCAVSKESA